MNHVLQRAAASPDLYEPDAHFARVLDELGIHRAIGVINLRTWHRYTGVYEFRRRVLRCVALFDKENLSIQWAPDELLHTTYCAIIARYSTAFTTGDARYDERLAHHPARDQVRAFHGVPLRDNADRCIGTLCHWDPQPRALPQREMRLLVNVAPIVTRSLLQLPSRPSAA